MGVSVVAAEDAFDGGCRGVNLKFAINVSNVASDGVQANAHLFGDFFVAAAFGKEADELLFAGAELFVGGAGGRGFVEGSDDLSGDGAGHGRTAVDDFHNGSKDFGGRGAFEQISGGASFEGLENEVVVVEHGENDDMRFEPAGFELAEALDAADPGHAQVQKDDVWLQFRDFLKGNFAVFEEASGFEARGAGDQKADGFPNDGIVFNHRDANDFRHGRG